ncbi:MAG TPA: tetratricopeptide repeat protein, partial [Longimicrobium sp.]|nr:tetratricopeptide repeat protein [Longimicrobium sp.]
MTRRSSPAPLPSAPLEFAYPVSIPAPEAQGAVIVREVPGPEGLLVLRAARLVLAWSAGPEAAAPLLSGAAQWEAELLMGDMDRALWAPLVTLAGELAAPAVAEPAEIARACLALSEWALEAGAEGTALLFAEAAALAWPEHPRYAWVAGKLLRQRGRPREAELWLKRAARVAVWCRDWETQDLALNSLGNLYSYQGRFPEAQQYLDQALNLARRRHLREREAAVSHDLLALCIWRGDLGRAQVFAARAFELYGAGHPLLPRLAHDVAQLWNQQGKFALALPVLLALEAHMPTPVERLRVLACAARAAGGCGDRAAFARTWADAWRIADAQPDEVESVISGTMLDLGLGAASAGAWDLARQALTRCLAAAIRGAEHGCAAQAEAALEMVERHERAETQAPLAHPGAAGQLSDRITRSLATAAP